MNIIGPKWEVFERSVIKPHATPLQRAEMRRAFYAGVAIMVGILAELSREDDEESNDRLVGSLLDEIREFTADVKRGAA